MVFLGCRIGEVLVICLDVLAKPVPECAPGSNLVYLGLKVQISQDRAFVRCKIIEISLAFLFLF